MRMKEMINDKWISGWFYKFSLLEPRKCVENSMETMHYDVGCKGLMFDSGVILCKGITVDAYYF